MDFFIAFGSFFLSDIYLEVRQNRGLILNIGGIFIFLLWTPMRFHSFEFLVPKSCSFLSGERGACINGKGVPIPVLFL